MTAVWYWPLGSADDKTGGADGGGGEFVGKRVDKQLQMNETVAEVSEAKQVEMVRLRRASQATRRRCRPDAIYCTQETADRGGW